MRVITDLSQEAPEIDIDFENGTKVSVFRNNLTGQVHIYVDPGEGIEDRPVVEYDPGYR